MTELSLVQAVKDRYKDTILARSNVVGVGAGLKMSAGVLTDQVCLVAMVRKKLPLEALAVEDVIPSQMETVPTDVLEVGDLRALQQRTDRWRPAPPGVSLGHYRITAGTFGCVVCDKTTGEKLILSNNHVLANENNASEGDPILQPGPADGGNQSSDTMGVLLRYVPLNFEGEASNSSCLPLQWLAQAAESVGWHGLADKILAKAVAQTNLVDAALARAAVGDLRMDILEIGVPEGVSEAALGMQVRKSGRTTELTTGQIMVLDSTVKVQYSAGRVAVFDNQILTSAMSQGGDSGSLLVTSDATLAVGLLFAGSDTVTIHSPIQMVLDQLDVEICP